MTIDDLEGSGRLTEDLGLRTGDQPVHIRIAHSPDSDDAFMFYGLACGAVSVEGLTFEHILADIETLNRAALEGAYEVSAVSFHAYSYLTDKYLLLPHGASMGEGYGPIVVTRRDDPRSLQQLTVAVPGTLTTAFLALRLYEPSFAFEVVPFDRILEKVLTGEAQAGLLIHEGQLTYAADGLTKLVDLGEWWAQRTGGLPLPLGGNVIRRNLGPDLIATVSRVLRKSIEYGLAHRDEALSYAMQFGRGLNRTQTDRFVGMYVNERTLDFGVSGREAVHRLLGEASEKGLIPSVEVEFASEAICHS